MPLNLLAKKISESCENRISARSKEQEAIRTAVIAFNARFSELELVLGNLLSAIINIKDSKIAHAIYYSPTSFDARSEIITNAIIQIATERHALAGLLLHWEKISEKIGQSRRLRNAIAHGSLLNISIGKTVHARLSPPAFDVIRVGRKIAKRQVPGLTASDINRGIQNLILLFECTNQVIQLLTEFHEGNLSLQGRYDELKQGVAKLTRQQ